MAKDKKKNSLSQAFAQAAKGVTKSVADNKSLDQKTRERARADYRKASNLARTPGRPDDTNYISNSHLRRNNPSQSSSSSNNAGATSMTRSRMNNDPRRADTRSQSRQNWQDSKGDIRDNRALGAIKAGVKGALNDTKTTMDLARNPNEDKYVRAKEYQKSRGIDVDKIVNEHEGQYGKLIRSEQDKRAWREKALEKDQKKSEEINKEFQDIKDRTKSKVGKFALDAAKTMSEMAVDAGTAAITGTGPVGYFGSMASRVVGQSYMDAKAKGATDDEAARFAFAEAGKEAATEGMFAPAGKLGKSIFGGGYAGSAAGDLSDKVANKLTGKVTPKALKDLVYGTTKTGFSALEEGIEEMVSEGLDPAVANALYQKNVTNRNQAQLRSELDKKVKSGEITKDQADAYYAKNKGKLDVTTQFNLGDVLYSGLLGGALGALGGGASAISQNAQGAQATNIYGPDGIKAMADSVVDVDESISGASEQAKAIAQMIRNGETVANGQVAELTQAAQTQAQRNQNSFDDSMKAAQKIIKDNGHINPVSMRVEMTENGPAITPTLTENTMKVYGQSIETSREALTNVINENGISMSEDQIQEVSEAIAEVQMGLALDPSTAENFTLSHPAERAALESVLGIKLADTNEGTRKQINTLMAENLVKTAQAEDQAVRNQMKGLVHQTEGGAYGRNGQMEFARTIDNVDAMNGSEMMGFAQTFNDYYAAGLNGEISLDEINEYGNPVHSKVPEGVRRAAYTAGIRDRQSAQNLLNGQIIKAGEDITKALSKASKSGNVATGVVEFAVSDESRKNIGFARSKMWQSIAHSLGIDIVLADVENMKTMVKESDRNSINNGTNGFYSGNRIVVNIDAQRGLDYTLVHELTHHLRLNAPEEYNRLASLVVDRWSRRGDMMNAIEKYRGGRSNESLTDEQILEEIIADSTWEFMVDEGFVDEVAKSSPSLSQAVLEAIRYILNRIRAALIDGGMPDDANGDLFSQLDILKEAEALWLDAYKKAQENVLGVGKMPTVNGVPFEAERLGHAYSPDVLYNLPPLNVVKLDINADIIKRKAEFDAYDINDVIKRGKENARKYNNSLNTETATYVYNSSLNDNINVTSSGIRHGAFSDKKKRGKRKFNPSRIDNAIAGSNIGDLLSNAVVINEGINNRNGKTLPEPRFVLAAQASIDGEPYTVIMVVVNNGTGYELNEFESFNLNTYSVNAKKTNKKEDSAGLLPENGSGPSRDSSSITIRELLENVNSIRTLQGYLSDEVLNDLNEDITDIEKQDVKFSQTDSEGNQLSEGQQEFFKDSKVRDEQGRLIPMYHGTNSPDFTVFDPEKSDDNRSLFFTSDPVVANSYTLAQDKGYDINPYDMLTKESSADDFNRIMEESGARHRVVMLDEEYIAQCKAELDKLLDDADVSQWVLDRYGATIRMAENHWYEYATAFVYMDEKIPTLARDTKYGEESDVVAAAIDKTKGYAGPNRYKTYINLTNPLIIDTTQQYVGKHNVNVEYDMLSEVVDITVDGNLIESFYSEQEADEFIKNTFPSDSDEIINSYKSERSYDSSIDVSLDRSGHWSHIAADNSKAVEEVKIEYVNDGHYNAAVTMGDGSVDNLRNMNVAELTNALNGLGLDTSKVNVAEAADSINKKRAVMDDLYRAGEIDEELRDYANSHTFYDLEDAQPSNINNTRGWAEYAQSNGYDGVIFKNLKDIGGYSGGLVNNASTVVIAFDSNQVKAVQNENPTSDPDIRFSVATELNAYPKASNPMTGSSVLMENGSPAMISGRESREKAMRDNGFSDDAIKNVNDFFDSMVDFIQDDLGMKYRFIGLKDLQKAKVKVRYKDGVPDSIIMSAMLKNGEYPVNFDFSAICKKREGMMQVIKALVNTPTSNGSNVFNSIELTDEQMWKINNALREEGFETACLGCFVEARRYNSNKFYKKIETIWNKNVRAARKKLGLPEDEYFNFADTNKDLTEITDKDMQAVEDLWAQYDESTEDKKSPNKRIKLLMNTIVKNNDVNSPYLKLISPSDVLTPEGIEGFKTLSTKGHDLVKTIKSFYGTSAPKEILAFTPYNSEIAMLPETKGGMTMKEYLKSIGGVRTQSFSDFKIENFFDYMQMIADMAARGFTGHAYTKEIAFAKIFGKTGMKINLSVMFDIDNAFCKKYGKKYAGLQFVDEANLDTSKFFTDSSVPYDQRKGKRYAKPHTLSDGRTGYLTYIVGDKDRSDSIYEENYQKNIAAGMSEDKAKELANMSRPFTQSINIDEAIELQNQEGYRENVGIIAVAYSEEHMKMLLEDPEIRYIIPYHKSGLPKFVSNRSNMDYALDFTKTQNTNKNAGIKKPNGKKFDTKHELSSIRKNKDVKYPYIELYKRMNAEGVSYAFGKKSSAQKTAMAGTADYDVYEHLNESKDPRAVVNDYLKYCEDNNFVPIFPEYAGTEGYYKVLFDFSITDGDKVYEQREVTNTYPAPNGSVVDVTKEGANLDELKSIVDEAAEEQNNLNIERNNAMGNVVDKLLRPDSDYNLLQGTNIQALNYDEIDYSNPKYTLQGEDVEDEQPSQMRLSQQAMPEDEPLDEDLIYDYMADHPEEFEQMWTAVQSDSDYVQHKQETLDELRAQVKKLKQNQKKTYGKVLDEKSVRSDFNEMVKAMLQASSEGRGVKKTDNKLVNQAVENAKTMFKDFAEGNLESMTLTAFNAAEDMVSGLKFINDDTYNYYRDLRDYLKTVPVRVDETVKNDIPDYNDWKKAQFGRLRIASDGIPVDTMYEELCGMFPEMFDRDITNPTDQLLRMGEAMEDVQPYAVFLSSEEHAALVQQIASDMIRITMEGKPYQSLVDRYEDKLNAVKQRAAEAERDAEKRYAVELDIRDEMLKAAREDRDAKIKRIREKQKAKDKKRKESRERAKSWKRLQDDYKWLTSRLLKPNDQKHIPEEFRTALAGFLQELDFQKERSKELELKYGRVSGATQKLLNLRSNLAEIAKEDGTGPLEYDGYVFQLMDAMLKKMEGLNPEDINALDELSNETLKDVSTILRSIKHGINNVDKARAEGIKKKISELGESTIKSCKDHIKVHGKYKVRQNFLTIPDQILNESMVTPRDMFERIGGGLEDVFMEIRHGFDKHVDNVDQAREFFKEVFKPYNNKGKPGSKVEGWRGPKSVQEFTLVNGNKVSMSTAQIMTLYCSKKRKQAADHIYGGGIVLTDVKSTGMKTWLFGKPKEIQNSCVKISPIDAELICSKLTQEQQNMADRLMSFLNNECAEWGNETSMAMYGYKKFTEPNYFPIKSSDQYLDSSFDARDSVEKIRNFGFTKGTVVNANNPIVIDDIFSVVANHINQMSMYNAFAAPISDFTRVYNYRTEDEDGIKTVAAKEAVSAAWGDGVQNYISNFIEDLQNQQKLRRDPIDTAVNKLLANYKKATIGFNLRVALQQPTAIVRAFTMISPKYFVNGNVNIKSNLKDMKEHCQIAKWKSWGFNQIDLANSMEDIMMYKEWSREDVMTMQIYGALDDVTWSTIWAAVKNETKAKHPELQYESPEFYEVCNERASEIFDKTQVVDSPLHRSQVMRKKDIMTKMLVSFMAEPTRTFNMMRSAYAEAWTLWKSGNKAEAAKIMSRYTTVYVANALSCAAAAAIADALRDKNPDDDDDDKTKLELWFANTWANFKDNANPLMMLPLAKDIWGFKDGWGTSNMAFEGVASLMETMQKIKDDGMNAKNFGDLLNAIGLVTGKPVKNIRRELKAWFGVDVFAATSEPKKSEAEENENLFDKIIGYIPFVGSRNNDNDGTDNSAMRKLFEKVGITDGSKADNILNHFGWNLTSEEQSERDKQEFLDKMSKEAKGYTESERRDTSGDFWKDVTKGYTGAAENGDVETLAMMREALEANGGDVEHFDEKVLSKIKTGIKKQLGDDGDPAKREALVKYLKDNYEWSDSMISHEILAKSDTAKDLQKALAAENLDDSVKHLQALYDAGLTDEDLETLWEKRWTAVDAETTGTFSWPASGHVTSNYGPRWGRLHDGMDIGMPTGTEVTAADGGEVIFVGQDGSRGKNIVVKHDNGLITRYQHLSWWDVEKGQKVAKGQYIGKSGNTGNSTGPHLHFSVYRATGIRGCTHANSIDPSKYLASN